MDIMNKCLSGKISLTGNPWDSEGRLMMNSARMRYFFLLWEEN